MLEKLIIKIIFNDLKIGHFGIVQIIHWETTETPKYILIDA